MIIEARAAHKRLSKIARLAKEDRTPEAIAFLRETL